MLFSNINIDTDLIYFGDILRAVFGYFKMFLFFLFVFVCSLKFIWYNFIVI